MAQAKEQDQVTGLPFLSSIYDCIAKTVHKGQAVGFVFFDIRQFRVLVKKQGDEKARSVMAALGKELKEKYRTICREDDILAISEKDEDCFVLLLLAAPRILPNLTEASVKKASQRILKFFNASAGEVAARFNLDGSLEFHSGYSLIPAEPDTPIERLVLEAQREAYRKSELSDILVNFLSNITHELRTPLTCIKGYTETLLDGALENKELACQWLRIISQEANRLEKLISDLADISMIEAQQFEFQREAVDLASLVRHAIDVLHISAVKHEIEISFTCPKNLPLMMLDPGRISQVILNLLDNAIKYSTGHSTVEVVIKQPSDSVVELEVHDHGPGIPESKLPYIFERFYRGGTDRDVYGRGLGLAIVKCIAEAHGGQVSVSSVVGQGSVFTLSLPVLKAD